LKLLFKKDTMKKNILLLLICFVSVTGCKKLIAVDTPKTELTPDKVFADEQTATAAVSAIYIPFNSLISTGLTTRLGLYSDELVTTSTDPETLEYADGAVSIANNTNLNIWRGFYDVIYQCNVLLENIDLQPNLKAVTKNQLKGETLFLRAVSYFYLINIYGDVPLILSSDVKTSAKTARSSIAAIYDRIIKDLEDVQLLVSTDYITDGRVRVNKWAAAALLSKVYLYNQKWVEAETAASGVINSGNYTINDAADNVTKAVSEETILQFWTQTGYTNIGNLFLTADFEASGFLVSTSLLNAFEANDKRKAAWVGIQDLNGQDYYYPFKYKNSSNGGGETEWLVLLRLGELYLIRAEARAQQNKITEALADINVIRLRAGLAAFSTNNQQAILISIDKEKRIELFGDWANRFFDLKRRQQLDAVNSILKPKWKATGVLLPIPKYELLNNAALVQNAGY
jgi:starch-binding outer membrane protein, SusD/RagB family